MKLVKPSYTILTKINGEQILADIERVARTCYKSEDKIKYAEAVNGKNPHKPVFCASSARLLIKKLIDNKHEAMLEFGDSITVKFICDRGISHELVRHRLASFAQESTRYCNYGNDEHIQFIIPSWLELKEGILDNVDHPVTDLNDGDIHKLYKIVNKYLRTFYNKDRIISNQFIGISNWIIQMLLSEAAYYSHLYINNWSPQQARSVLPNSLKTEINIKANIREWRHIFTLRTAKAAHPQMRELMCPLLDDFKSKIPILFDDITT